MVLGNLKGVLACAAALVFGQVAWGQDDAPQVDEPIVSAVEVTAAEAKCDAAPAPDCLAVLALHEYLTLDIDKRGGLGQHVGQMVALQMGAGEVDAALKTARLAPDEQKVVNLLPDKTRAFELMREEIGPSGASEDPKHFARMEEYLKGLVHYGDMHAKIGYGDLDGALLAARMTGPVMWSLFDREFNIAYVGKAALDAGDTSMAISIAMEVRNAEDNDRLVLKIVEKFCDNKEFNRAEGMARLIRNDDRRASGLAVVGNAVARFGAKSDAARLFAEAFDLLQAEAVFPDDKARRFLDLATAQFDAGYQAKARVSALRAHDWLGPQDAGERTRSYGSGLRAEIATLLSQLGVLDQAVLLRDEALAAISRPFADEWDLRLALEVRVALLQFGGAEVTAAELRDIVMLLTLPQRRNFDGFVTVHDFDFVLTDMARRGLVTETIILSQISSWFGTNRSFSATKGYSSAADVDPALVDSALPLIFNDVTQNDVRIIVAAAYARHGKPDEASRLLREVVDRAKRMQPQPSWFLNDQTMQLGLAAGLYAEIGLHHEARETITLAYALAKTLEKPPARFEAYVEIGFLLLHVAALDG